MRSFYIWLLLLGAWECLPGCRMTVPEQPNIILILADDMGYSDLGCYGSEIPTPNIDRLATKGIRFTQFYNGARCSPSRASLLTGLYPHQAGVGYLTSDWAQYIRDSLGAPGYQNQLSKNVVTIAEALRPAGYATYMSGKWHVGQERPYWPVDRGFDSSIVVLKGYHYFHPQDGLWAKNDALFTPDTTGFYATNYISNHAARFIRQHDAHQPFFLYLAYTAPHWPLHAPAGDIARHRGKYLVGWDSLRQRRYEKMISMGIIDGSWHLSNRDEDAPAWDSLSQARQDAWDLRMAVYAAQIEILDRGIGTLMNELDARGKTQNTLIFFLSDNGASAEPIDRDDPDAETGTAGSFLAYGLPWANASNSPFRLYKHWVHEGGIATPLIVSWPGQLSGDKYRVTHEQGHLIDIMATCLEVAGADYPHEFRGHEIIPMEGRSLLPLLRGEARESHRALFWEHEGNRAVRQGNWKLVSRYRQPWELYDLAGDRSELHDRSGQHPGRVSKMSAMYEEWARRAFVVPWEKTGK